MTTSLTTALKRFLKDENGAAAIEYGLLAALIGVAIISAVRGIGTQLNTTFTDVTTALQGPPAAPPAPGP